MAENVTVTLPDGVKRALDEISSKEGVAPDEVIGAALKEHLFLRQFRSLRQRMAAKAQSQGVLTDEDVFDRVS